MASQDTVTEASVPGEGESVPGDGDPVSGGPGGDRGAGWWARVGRGIRPRRRWCLGTRLVVTGSVAWLVFVVGHRLLSGRVEWWWPFDLAPPLVFLAVPALLLVVAPFARPVRWRVIALLLVTGLLGLPASGVNLATLGHTLPPAPADAVTVVSWNTEFWDQRWRGGGGGYDAGFYPYLRALDADVYLLSEYLYADAPDGDLSGWTGDMAMRIDALPRLAREFPGYHVAVAGEQLTLSRFPILAQRGLDIRPWLPERYRGIPAELRDWPEGYTVETLRTDIALPSGTASFYNTQILQPPVDWRVLRAQSRGDNHYHHVRREASYRALRDDLDGNSRPVVVAGDLNSSPAMGVRRLLPERLVDHTRALSSVYPATWQAGGFALWRIDWLYATAEVAVHSYEILRENGMSDHRPQRFVLSVSG